MRKGIYLYVGVLLLTLGCSAVHKQADSGALIASNKLASALIVVANKLEAGANPAEFAAGNVRADRSGRIQVYVHVAKLTPDMLTELVDHGLEEAIPSSPLHVVQGWVLPQKLEALAALPFVTRITPPQYGYPH